MKLLSFVTLSAILSLSACSHHRKCCAKEKEAQSCSKEKACCKEKECKDGSCKKEEPKKT